MDREILIKDAEELRKRGGFAELSPEAEAALPVKQAEQYILAGSQRVHVFEFRPSGSPRKLLPMLISLHGGGFIKGRSGRDQVYCSEMSEALEAVIWDIDYSLAPEYPFPTALEETYAIIAYVFQHHAELNIDPTKVLLLGHSAGGNLTATACIKAAMEGKPFPIAGMLLDYIPTEQVSNPLGKLADDEKQDPKCVARAVVEKRYQDFYCRPEETFDPLVSPLFAPEDILAAFPDCLVITAGKDTLKEEGEAFALKLARSGVTVTLRRFKNSMHGFTINRIAEWEDALKLHQEFIKARL